MRYFFTITFACFSILFILTVPFPFQVFPSLGEGLWPIFGSWASWTGELMGLDVNEEMSALSDGRALWIHTFHLLGISTMLSALSLFKQNTHKQVKVGEPLFRSGIAHYLALIMLIYGLSKVFKHQFYLPEPNTLYTPLGQLPKNLLYWSTIGSSYGYSMFLGLTEVLCALLLFLPRTRLLAALMTLGVMINVLAVDLSFQISVKLLSLFLAGLSLYICWPLLRKLFLVLTGKTITLSFQRESPVLKWSKPWPQLGKGLVLLFLLAEGFIPYLKSQNFQDDLASRPTWHGAYEVVELEGDLNIPQVQRLFVHRRNALVFQDQADNFHSFPTSALLGQNEIAVGPKNDLIGFLKFHPAPQDEIILRGVWERDSVFVRAKRLEWEELPLLQDDFAWTVEGYLEKKR